MKQGACDMIDACVDLFGTVKQDYIYDLRQAFSTVNIECDDLNIVLKPKSLSDFPLYKYKVNQVGVEHLLETEINDIIKENGDDPRVIDVNDERRFILMWLVHLCDISNCAKSLKSGKKWAIRVMTEFFKQGDRERSMGLNVSAMMDRRRSSTPRCMCTWMRIYTNTHTHTNKH